MSRNKKYILSEEYISMDNLYLMLTNNKRVIHLVHHAKKKRVCKKNMNRVINYISKYVIDNTWMPEW